MCKRDEKRIRRARHRREGRHDLLKVDVVRSGSRKRGVPCHITIVDLHNIWMKQRGRCAYCRRTLGADYHVDHITPVAASGTSEPGNLQFACPGCNVLKGATDPVDFARQIGRLI